jgi:hypothetical protein
MDKESNETRLVLLSVALPPSILNEMGVSRGDTLVITIISAQQITLTPLGKYIGSLPPELRDKGIIKM